MKDMYRAFLIDDYADDHKFFKLALSRLSVPVLCDVAYDGQEAIVMHHGYRLKRIWSVEV